MRAKDYLILFLIGTAVALAAARFIPVPGYMDAEYYYANSTQLATGHGFYEPFLWNYLDDPAGIPHAANTYWMPLASIISAIGLFVTGKADFFSARIFFILLAGLIAPLTAFISWRFSRKRIVAWLAGGLAVFSGFYAIYMGITDTFALFMVLGALFLILGTSSIQPSGLKFFCLGLAAGLMHLARADGLLWLVCGVVLAGIEIVRSPVDRRGKGLAVIKSGGSLLLGYLLVMLPWYVRNVDLYGGLFSPAGGRVLWLADYNQMFAFPASQLNFQNWLATGLGNMLQIRGEALSLNLQTTLAVQAQIFLIPMLLLGAWRLRKMAIVRLAFGMWLATFFLMTLVFPLAGDRGGFFHSGAAFQPVFWAISAEGFVGLIEFGVRKRNWKLESATKGFGFLLILVSALITLALFLPQVISDASTPSAWAASNVTYQAVDQYLVEAGVAKDQIIVVNNPPGYFTATGRQSIVIPDGNIQTLLNAAKKYGAGYLVLEQNTVKDLLDLYKNPRSEPGLAYVQSVGDVRIFKIVNP